MYLFCLILSVLAAALGVFALGFGVKILDFSLGNTMIMAGATGVVGGMIMFGLAAVVRQLGRIADMLRERPAAVVRRPAAPEAVEVAPPPFPAPAQRQAPGARMPFPPRPGADPRAPAAPPAPPPTEIPEAPGPAERPRPNILGAARNAGEAPMMEEEVPLAPSRMPASPMGRGAPPAAEPPPRPPERPTQADIMARLSNLAATPPRPVPRPEPPRGPPPPPPPPPVERSAPAERTGPGERPAPAERTTSPPDPRRTNMFDSLWPAEVRAARQSQSETIARATRSEPPRADMRTEPRPERGEPRPDQRPEPRFEPPPAPRERIEPPGNGAAREPMSPPAEPRTIAILKSGVIDGMAYTLYTDGSIEAELPQGTMRFSSIDDLRSHLEKADRQA